MLNCHIFAFYTPEVSRIIKRQIQSDTYELNDQVLIHRLGTILRLEESDRIELFDETHNIKAVIAQISKKSILIEIVSIENNKIQLPAICWILPTLKRDAYEQALYALTEIGVQEIQLTYTQKTKHSSFDQKDLERAQKIIISAAEQSKNFAMPKLMAPVNFEQLIYKISQMQGTTNCPRKIFFDFGAQSIINLIKNFENRSIIAMCGPEGDLTEYEKQILQQCGFEFYSLTKTILRSQQAISIGAGILRSI